jgi:hypothetical protein
MAYIVRVGSANQEFCVEDLDSCASGSVERTNGDRVLSIVARSVTAAKDDMLLIVNALR